MALAPELDDVDITPVPDEFEEISLLSSFAISLFEQFYQNGHLPDLQFVISICQRLLHQNLPIHHPKRLEILNNLVCFLPTWFSQTGDVRDLDEAIPLHRKVLMFLPVLRPDHPGSLNNLANILAT